MMRRNLLHLLFVVAFVFLYSCASIPQEKSQRLTDDLGSPRKVKLLENRASEYWAAMVKGDLKTAYTYFDPFLRARMSPEQFAEKHGLVKYHDYSVEKVKVEGNIGTVTVKVKYSVPKVRIKEKEFSMPETTKEIVERWLFVYDNWYKEYYLALFESGMVEY